VAEWVKLCTAAEAPGVGELKEIGTRGDAVCLANLGGRLAAMDNLCPHRGGPLAEGWVEGETVVCPWHCWAFSATTGMAEPPERAHVRVYPVKVEDGEILADLG
jgi:nitrite reductase (NADH) small subunit